MNDHEEPRGHDRIRSKSQLLAKLSRYWGLLLRKWWILALGIALGAAVEGLMTRFDAPSFVSVGRMMVSPKLSITEVSVYNEELSNFLGTQSALMQSGAVVNKAYALLAAQKPDVSPRPVSLRVSVVPKTTIFNLTAAGGDPEYTRDFLQAAMEAYMALKKEMREATSDTTLSGLTEQAVRLDKDLRKCDEELVAFQSTNRVDVLQDSPNNAATWLLSLNQGLAGMKSEYSLLQTLTLDQALDEQQRSAAVAAGTNDVASKSSPVVGTEPSVEYLKAKQDILMAKADRDELGQYLRPKHPKMIALSEDIQRRERLLEIYRQQSLDQLESRKAALAVQITNRQKEIVEQDAAMLVNSRKNAEFQRLKDNQTRIRLMYERLQATMQQLDVNKQVSPESVTITEKASDAAPDRPKLSRKLLTGALAGFALGLIVLLLLDRLDDRMSSFTELQEMFDETVLVQIPREKPARADRELSLIGPEDDRHSFVEAYRNLRSSLFFMSGQGERPRTVLVTSSVPNEGKTLTSANLAITIANAGTRVLLVDADLRKGALHNRFGMSAEHGLSEALSNGSSWEEAVQPTKVPNLWLLPRGTPTQRSGELFMGDPLQKFLAEAASQYDCVLLDTAPVMAADDVTSLAPFISGVVFVVRSDYTSARVARAALDLLYQRNARLLGLVFNAVSPRSVDYHYYYKYKDYYRTYPTATAGASRK